MFVEKRKYKDKIKYYLVHSYRDEGKVKKIRKYLGMNLSKKELEEKKRKAKKSIKKEIQELSLELFNFALKPSDIKKLNKLTKKITINHLNKGEWKRFEQDFVYNTNAIEGSKRNL